MLMHAMLACTLMLVRVLLQHMHCAALPTSSCGAESDCLDVRTVRIQHVCKVIPCVPLMIHDGSLHKHVGPCRIFDRAQRSPRVDSTDNAEDELTLEYRQHIDSTSIAPILSAAT